MSAERRAPRPPGAPAQHPTPTGVAAAGAAPPRPRTQTQAFASALAESAAKIPETPLAPAPLAPAPLVPASLASAPVARTPVAPAPLAPPSFAPARLGPAPIAPPPPAPMNGRDSLVTPVRSFPVVASAAAGGAAPRPKATETFPTAVTPPAEPIMLEAPGLEPPSEPTAPTVDLSAAFAARPAMGLAGLLRHRPLRIAALAATAALLGLGIASAIGGAGRGGHRPSAAAVAKPATARAVVPAVEAHVAAGPAPAVEAAATAPAAAKAGAHAKPSRPAHASRPRAQKAHAAVRRHAPARRPLHVRRAPAQASRPASEKAAPAPDPDREQKARAAYHRGNEQLFLGDAAAAASAYQEAIRLNPGDASGYRGLGLASAQQGKRPEAIRYLRAYLKRAPSADDRALISDRIALLRGGK